MQYRCADCQKLIKGPKPGEPKHKHYYCDECRKRIVEQLIVRDAACRRELKEIRRELEDVTRGNARTEEEKSNVLVFGGIGEMAKAVRQEVKVAEMSDEDILARAFKWIFSFEYKGTYYFTYGSEKQPEDVEIVKEWEAKHGTFY